MSEKDNKKDVTPVVAAKTVSPKKKFSGRITYNPNIDNYSCVSNDGRCMLSGCSLSAAKQAYPDYEVIERKRG